MPKICIIGGANIDLCGVSLAPLEEYDSNPAQISMSFGGVGRNIAQICCLLKKDVQFVSCFSSDHFGRLLQEDCLKLGMDLNGSVFVDSYPTSMYIAILNENGDMHMGMSDMRILEHLDQKVILNVLQKLDKDDIVVCDGNLSQEDLTFLIQHARCKVAADPVSKHKVERLKHVLSGLTIFKPNQYEAKALNGIAIVDEQSAKDSLDWFLKQGVKEVIISLSERGTLFATTHKKVWITHRHLNVANATGGGDTLLGSYISQRIDGVDEITSIRFAIAAAALTIEQNAVKRRSLSANAIAQELEQLEIKEKIL